MSAVHQTVSINASVEKVFEFLNDPQNVARCAPGAMPITDVVPSAQLVAFRVRYKTLGIEFDERGTVSSVHLPPKTTPHRRYQIRRTFDGGMIGTLTWTLEAQDTETDVSLDLEYELKWGIAGKTLDALVFRRTTRRNTALMLARMKSILAMERAGLPV